VPFVIIQIIMVGLVIAFPQMVMVYKGKETAVNPNEIEIQLPPGDSASQPGATPSDQQQESADSAAKSLEEQLRAAPAPPPAK